MSLRYYAEDDDILALVREHAKRADILAWHVPTSSDVVVFYARDSDGKVWFMPNARSQCATSASIFAIDDAADLQTWIRDADVPIIDRKLYAEWLELGLREVLLAAPTLELS